MWLPLIPLFLLYNYLVTWNVELPAASLSLNPTSLISTSLNSTSLKSSVVTLTRPYSTIVNPTSLNSTSPVSTRVELPNLYTIVASPCVSSILSSSSSSDPHNQPTEGYTKSKNPYTTSPTTPQNISNSNSSSFSRKKQQLYQF